MFAVQPGAPCIHTLYTQSHIQLESILSNKCNYERWEVNVCRFFCVGAVCAQRKIVQKRCKQVVTKQSKHRQRYTLCFTQNPVHILSGSAGKLLASWPRPWRCAVQHRVHCNRKWRRYLVRRTKSQMQREHSHHPTTIGRNSQSYSNFQWLLLFVSFRISLCRPGAHCRVSTEFTKVNFCCAVTIIQSTCVCSCVECDQVFSDSDANENVRSAIRHWLCCGKMSPNASVAPAQLEQTVITMYLLYSFDVFSRIFFHFIFSILNSTHFLSHNSVKKFKRDTFRP